jgi:beta-RFAP synthase
VRAWDLGDAACLIEVLGAPGSHMGLGSGTQLGLAVAAGVRHLFRPPAVPVAADAPGDMRGCNWSFDARDVLDLARASGRGRRSCIGVHGFSRGGMIVEGGRLLRDDEARGDAAARGFSPLLARVPLPAEWRCVVVGQRGVVGLHGDAEKQAFAALPPVPREISAELSMIALMDLLPAAIEGRFAEFSDAVFRYGALAGKPFEQASSRLPHAGTTAALIGWLRDAGVRGCAQSSWGPIVMACCPTPAAAEELVGRLAVAHPAGPYETTIARFDTRGAVLRELPLDQARPTGSP